MVQHITLWKLKDFACGNDKETNFRISKELSAEVAAQFPKLLRSEVYRGFKSGGQNYDMVNILEFASRDDLEEFLVSPIHVKAHDFNKEIRSERAVIDFEF